MENNATTPSTSERRTTLTPQQLKAVRRCLKFLHKKNTDSKDTRKLFPKRLHFSPTNSPVSSPKKVSSTATTIEYCSPQPSPTK